jgi:hypothetical protein
MEKKDLTWEEMEESKYRVFKGYSVKLTKNQKKTNEERFIVPWEIAYEGKKPIVY